MPKGVYVRQPGRIIGRPFERGHKDSIETRQRKRVARLGSLNPMFGKHRTREEKDKISATKQGKQCHRGEKNPNWRGGISKLTHVVRTHPEYSRWRIAILQRDNYTCQICGRRGGDLNVDHYPKTFKQILQENSINSLEEALNCAELWDINNNRTLCVPCHRAGG